MKDPRRDLRAYRHKAAALKARTKARGDVCWLCGEGFDWSLPYTDRLSFTADHVNPISKGGHIVGELRPAHRACNSRRNDGRHEVKLPTTRRW